MNKISSIVKCDDENNPPSRLAAGKTRVDVYLKGLPFHKEGVHSKISFVIGHDGKSLEFINTEEV